MKTLSSVVSGQEITRSDIVQEIAEPQSSFKESALSSYRTKSPKAPTIAKQSSHLVQCDTVPDPCSWNLHPLWLWFFWGYVWRWQVLCLPSISAKWVEKLLVLRNYQVGTVWPPRLLTLDTFYIPLHTESHPKKWHLHLLLPCK